MFSCCCRSAVLDELPSGFISRKASEHTPPDTASNGSPPDADSISIAPSSATSIEDSAYDSEIGLRAQRERDLRSHPLDDLPEERLPELSQKDFGQIVALIEHNSDGLESLAFSLESVLATLDPGLSKLSLDLALPFRRRRRALAIMSALHDDPDSKLFPICIQDEEIRGLIGLARREQRTHLFAWLHLEDRRQHFGEDTIKEVLAQRFREEPRATIHASVPKDTAASHLLKKLQFTPPVGDLNTYTLRQA